MTPPPDHVLRRLRESPPRFHGEGEVTWSATRRTLEVIAEHVRPGFRTVETGCGSSTVVFAAGGAHHLSISPFPDEHRRVRDYCAEIGVPTDDLRFTADSSDAVLPTLELDGPLDMVFIDGSHSFPYPVIDWHYLHPRLRVGALLLLDDIAIPAVSVVFRAMRLDPDWELVEIADNRSALFRKVREPDPADVWALQPFNRGKANYSFAPVHRRIAMHARQKWNFYRRMLGRRFPGLKARLRNLRPR